MINNISPEFVEYHFFQGKYINLMLKKEKYKGYNELQWTLFFPNNWDANRNYINKIEILKKAIDQNICITEMPESLDFEEGVRYK